jgi:hypothetical protein
MRLASGKLHIEWMISMDSDDPSMNNEEVRETFDKMIAFGTDLKYFYGNSTTKIQAINADMEKANPHWEVLFLAQDDMIPIAQDWDEKMVNLVKAHWPDLDGAVWPPDGYGNSQTVATVILMGRNWYERFNYIYHPEYISVYCDNEFTDVALSYNKIVRVEDKIVEHKWIGVNGRDELCDRNESASRYNADRELFVRRTLAGFP